MEISRNFINITPKYEHLFYVVLGCLVVSYPVIQELSGLMSGSAFDWHYIIQTWFKVLPFIVVLVIHSIWVVPVLLVKHDTGKYLLLTGGLILLLFASIYAQISLGGLDFVNPVAKFNGQEIDFPRISGGPAMRPPMMRPIFRKIPPPAIIGTIIGILLIGCNLAFKLMIQNFEIAKTMEEYERTKAQQELSRLKAQISPHFLMNSLNNIHSLIETNPKAAQDLILNLSGMLRYILYQTEAPYIPVEKEIDFLTNYLSVMRARYSPKKVNIFYSFPDKNNTKGLCIPPLLLISLVENAFKHGVDYKYQSFVNVAMTADDKELTFCCFNSNHKNKKQDEDSGVGLTNLSKQLDLLYQDNYKLSADETESSYKVILIIPTTNENTMLSDR